MKAGSSSVAAPSPSPDISLDHLPPAGKAVGAAVRRLDGTSKIDGRESFGADGFPADALSVLVVRSPHYRARFELGDTNGFVAAHPGIVARQQGLDGLAVATFMPADGVRQQDGASTRSPSISTMHARQLPAGSMPSL